MRAKLNPVVMGIASQPRRKDTLEIAIRSVIGQVDILNVYLNGYRKIPAFLASPTPFIPQSQFEKIRILRSQDLGNRGALGKHYLPEPFEGYRFTIDDDILYPPDYVQTLIKKIEQYERKFLVGIHGCLLTFPVQSFVRDRQVIPFERPLAEDQFVHMLGCGTLAYHTSTFRFRFEEHEVGFMDDVQVAVQAQQDQVGMVCIERPYRWLTNIDRTYDQSLAVRFHRDRRQTNLIRSIDWRLHGRDLLVSQPLADFVTSFRELPSCGHRQLSTTSQEEATCGSPRVFARSVDPPICATCSWRIPRLNGTSLKESPISSKKHVSKWMVGVTTAPRRLPTLEKCLNSLTKAGWSNPQIFAEPHSTLPTNFADLRISHRPSTLGAFANWYLALTEMYLKEPHADAYMLCQDDTLFSSELRSYLEAKLWPAARVGVVSPYCASHYSRSKTLGFYELDLGWDFWGALCLIFPNPTVREFLSDAIVINHRHHGPMQGSRNIDSIVGDWCRRSQLPVFVHSPSLAQHIGETSTIYPRLSSAGKRRARDFAQSAPASGIGQDGQA